MANFNLASSVREISHIARGVEAQLKHLGVKSARDLLFYFPARYDDLSKITPIAQAMIGQRVVIKGRIELLDVKRSRFRKKLITHALVSDNSGSIRAIWFNQQWIAKIFKVGDELYLVGEIKDDGSGAFLSSPAYEKVSRRPAIHSARLVPVYPSTEKLSQKQLRFLIRQTLPLVDEIEDELPDDIKLNYNLLDLRKVLSIIHFPSNEALLEKARHRLKFDELFRLQLFSSSLKRELKKLSAIKIFFQEKQTKGFVESLPFKLTDDQRKASWEIIKDMEKGKPMNRLLEGDVGSGKTVVVAIAALNCVLGIGNKGSSASIGEAELPDILDDRGQVAIMAPTEILARQHFKTFSKFLEPFGISVALHTSATKRRASSLGDDVIVGTHALIQEKVKFRNLVLVVVDEQHRFGVDQRKALKEKRKDGKMPHLLTLTATPIPRSLALVFYGDLDISILREMPKGRQKIETRIVTKSQTESDLVTLVRTEIKKGHQVFWTCPIIDPSDTLGVKAATQVFEHLKNEVFRDLKIGLLHGRMKSKEREKIMGDFVGVINTECSGDDAGAKHSVLRPRIDILVATPVIEVGIDVPNATVMVIEGAERFGLAQLHQFRGRVGRGDAQSYCLLMVSGGSTSVEMRMRAFLECQDGFDLAEKDLALRGPGEMYGTAQTGFPEFKIATFADVDIAKQAKSAAETILQHDPELKQYPELKKEILKKEGSAHLE